MKHLLRSVSVMLLILAAQAADQPAFTNSLPPAVTLADFKLFGDLSGDQAAFTLTGTARVQNPKGGSLELLTGTVALTEVGPHPNWRVRAESNRFLLVFERAGKFPIRVKFNAAVREHDSWKSVAFHVAP